MTTEIKCPIYHYALDYKGTDAKENYKSITYFNKRTSASGISRQTNYCDVTASHTTWSRGVDADGILTLGEPRTDENHIIADGLGSLIIGVGFHSQTSHSDDGGYYTYEGRYSSIVKMGTLFCDPIPNNPYPIWIISHEYGIDSETGREVGPEKRRAILLKEIIFEQDEILEYLIDDKVMKFASKELLLPTPRSEFESIDEFLTEFVRQGYVNTSEGELAYLKFKEGFDIPFEFEVKEQVFYNLDDLVDRGYNNYLNYDESEVE